MWKHPWSRVNRCHLLCSFPSIAFHFVFISSHVPFILLSCPFMSFHVPLLCMYQRYRSSKTDMLKPVRWVSAQRLAFFSYFVIVFNYRLAIVLEACEGCHLQAAWTCMYKFVIVFFYSYRFLGRQCIGSVKVQAKLKWNAQGYYRYYPICIYICMYVCMNVCMYVYIYIYICVSHPC